MKPALPTRGIGFPSYYALAACVAAGFVWFVFTLCHRPAWILSDDAQLLRTILSGLPWPHDGNWVLGRFNPLYYVEFEPLAHLGNRPDVAFAWVALKVVLTAMLLFPLLASPNGQQRWPSLAQPSRGGALTLVFFALFWLSPGVFQVFSVTIYPEQTLIPLLALLVLGRQRFATGRRAAWGLAALLAANGACYLKEPAFLIVSAIALSGLLSRQREDGPPAVRKLDWALLASAGLFVLLYYLLSFRNTTQWYQHDARIAKDHWAVARAITLQHPLLASAATMCALRLPRILHARAIALQDKLLAAGLAYALAFVCLRLDALYYLAPIYVLLIPALLKYVSDGLSSRSQPTRIAACGLLTAVGACYVSAPGRVLEEARSVGYARAHDGAFVDTLLPYRTYFLQPERHPHDSGLGSAADDEWRRVTLETFLDFHRHGRYTDSSELPEIRQWEAAALASDRPTMLLTPERHARELERQAPDFRRVTSYFGLAVYALPRLVRGSKASAASSEYFLDGWSPYEPSAGARWTDDRHARLRAFVGNLTSPARFTLSARAFLPRGARRFRVTVGQRAAGLWRYDDPDTFEDRTITVLPNDLAHGFVQVTLIADDAPTPKEAGLSRSDTRQLGLLCRSFRLD